MNTDLAIIRADDDYGAVVVIHRAHPTLADGGGRAWVWHATEADRAALVVAGGDYADPI